MHDWFLILTPALAIGVVALLGFVGCNQIFGIEGTKLGHRPQLDSLMPTLGPSAGGTPVKLTGSVFTGIDTVSFGTVDVPVNAMTITDSNIDVISPSNPVGTVDVVAKISTDTSYFGSSNALPFEYVAIGFVQIKAISQAAGTSISVTLDNPVGSGNMLIAAVAAGGAGTLTVTDNNGNTFSQLGTRNWFGGRSGIFYLANISGGNVKVTVTGTSGGTLCVSEYTGGIALANFSANNSPNTGTPGVELISGVTVSPAAGNMAFVAVFAAQPTMLAPGPGFNQHVPNPPDAVLLVEDVMSAVSGGQTVATDDTTGLSFAPWVVLAAEIQA